MVGCAVIVTLGGVEKSIQCLGAKRKETTWKMWT
jgi:hypothetical protein